MRVAGAIALLVAALAALLWLTVAGQRTTCEACIAFRGQKACKTASAGTVEEAIRHAQATACALVTRGVTEDLSCQRAAPETVRCE